MYAAIKGFKMIIKALLNTRGAVGSQVANTDIANVHGNTALMAAAHFNHINVVEILLEHGADVNIKNKLGNTALIGAVEAGHVATVELLLMQQGIEIDTVRGDNQTALTLAVANDDANVAIRLAEALMKHGAACCAATVQQVIKQGRHELALVLIENGAEINCEETEVDALYGDVLPPIVQASLEGHVEIVKALPSNAVEGLQGDRCPEEPAFDKTCCLPVDHRLEPCSSSGQYRDSPQEELPQQQLIDS